MSSEEFYAHFSDRADGGLLVSHGPKSGQISLKAMPDRLFVLVEGEPDGKVLTDCFREALASDRFNIDVPSVVDLTRYHGQVDWAALRAIRDMAPWKPHMTAIVVRPHTMFDLIIKIVGTIFVNAQLRIFNSHDEAVSWLDSAPPTHH